MSATVGDLFEVAGVHKCRCRCSPQHIVHHPKSYRRKEELFRIRLQTKDRHKHETSTNRNMQNMRIVTLGN